MFSNSFLIFSILSLSISEALEENKLPSIKLFSILFEYKLLNSAVDILTKCFGIVCLIKLS